MVFQEPLLFDTTVFENVASGLKIRGMQRPEIRKIVAENLERFGISPPAAPFRPKNFRRGGPESRPGPGLCHPPGDPLSRRTLLLPRPPHPGIPARRPGKSSRQTKTTTLMATHDRMEALRLSDRIAVMNQGRILQIGPPAEVMNQPLDEFVASFVGVETILTGRGDQERRGQLYSLHHGAGSRGRGGDGGGRIRGLLHPPGECDPGRSARKNRPAPGMYFLAGS